MKRLKKNKAQKKKPNLFELKAKFLSGIGRPPTSEFIPDLFQSQAISEVLNGNDTLVVAPTGSGKTFIATSCISVYLSLGLSCIYTTPLKALSNTKYIEFQEKFKEAKVGILTGDRKIDTDANLLVATTEILRNEIIKGSITWSLIVFDEVHFLSDLQRGIVWEESIIFAPKQSILLLLSATVGNPEEFRDWISQVRGKKCSLIVETRRPVELRYGFAHNKFGALPLEVLDEFLSES